MSLVWVNGVLVDKAEARVSPFDHGFLYGDGVWEPLRVSGGRPFRPAAHLAHLAAAAESIGLALPHTPAELTAALDDTVRANHRTAGYCRVIVTRGPGTIGPDPRKLDPQVFVTAEEYQPFPVELAAHGLHVVTTAAGGPGGVAYRLLGRPHVVAAKRAALARGCLDAVLLTAAGRIAGTTEGAVFLVTGGRIRQAEDGPPEVAADVVREAAAGIGVGFAVAPADGSQLAAADEIFLAGTACGVIGVVRVDGRGVGAGTEGPVTRAVRAAYREATRGPDTMPAEGGAP